MFKYSLWNAARGACVGAGLFLMGCGGPGNVAEVSGQVTFDSQPLADATVQFQPIAGNSPSAAITDSSGHYTLRYTRETEGAEIGEHTVTISTYLSGNEDAEPPRPAVPEKLPQKYNAKTELKATVKAGSNTLDFPLESKGKIVQPKPAK